MDIFQWPSGGFAIADREGVIAVHHDQPNAPPPRTILDLTARAVVCCENGSSLLSAALDPQFQDFPFLYVWYRTLAPNALGEGEPSFVGRLARFRVENDSALAPPAVAYPRTVGCAIIGGVAVPWLNNGFIFSDLCARRVWLMERAAAQEWRMREIVDLVDAVRSVLAFGHGENGSVYILAYDNPILRLDPSLADHLPDAPASE